MVCGQPLGVFRDELPWRLSQPELKLMLPSSRNCAVMLEDGEAGRSSSREHHFLCPPISSCAAKSKKGFEGLGCTERGQADGV